MNAFRALGLGALGLAVAVLLIVASAHGQPPPSFSARELLDAHNAARKHVGSPPLVWSSTLANHARSWAEHLVATHTFARQLDDPHGENLFLVSGGTIAPTEVVQAWVAEMRDYDPSTNSCNGVCGHYTQVVWRATRAVGCGVAVDGSRQVWVCKYDPAGNVFGVRPY
jgi:uncharacterized protein YkwD